jgi:hypothetical protein
MRERSRVGEVLGGVFLLPLLVLFVLFAIAQVLITTQNPTLGAFALALLAIWAAWLLGLVEWRLFSGRAGPSGGLLPPHVLRIWAACTVLFPIAALITGSWRYSTDGLTHLIVGLLGVGTAAGLWRLANVRARATRREESIARMGTGATEAQRQEESASLNQPVVPR